MKTNPIIPFAATFLLITGIPVRAQDSPQTKPPETTQSAQIRVMLEFIEVSHEQLTELLFTPRTTSDDTALRKQLAGLVKQGKAKVVETLIGVGRIGQMGTTESIEEFIYPTEYEPAELPNEIHISGTGKTPNGSDPDIATPPTPTAFETRNLGATLEWEAMVTKEGRHIDLRLAPEIVWHVGNTVWSEWKDKRSDAPIQMPRMYTMHLNTGITVASGQPTLVAALSPKDENGHRDPTRKWIVFVRCDILE